MKMQSIMSIRLSPEDIKMINEIATREKIDKSTAVRELVEMGKVYFAISKYKEGKISIGKAAEIADLPLSEIMDLFADLGIRSNLTMEDYLAGAKVAEEILK
ncbi:MAG: hypothetical protein CMI53_01625 [Parcubacteria group bacterium]|nr:hypothetical protein [Parcubacteria group bacterium]|tara:strand:+ start:1981 stop:2286 length:306 start_codon:yes stop_codon:yes gene_type:complete